MKYLSMGIVIALVQYHWACTTCLARDNERDVTNSLKERYEKVIFGKHFNHVEYLKAAAAIAGGGGTAAAYFQELAAEIAKDTGAKVAIDTLIDVAQGKSKETVIGGKPVYVGFATYRHWTEENIPFTDRKWIKPEPNTHQLYVAIGKKPTPKEEHNGRGRPVPLYPRCLLIVQNNRLHRVDPEDGEYAVLEGDWGGATSAATLNNDNAFIVQNRHLHAISATTGKWKAIGGSDWDGPTQMATLGDMLYIAQNGRLYQVNPENGKFRRIDDTDWRGATSMATDGQSLYIIQNKNLYKVNSQTGKFTSLGKDWDGPTAMTFHRGSLFIVQNRRLHKVDEDSGKYKAFDDDWSGATSITSSGASLYIIQNSRLHKVNPQNGKFKVLEGKWDGSTVMTSISEE